MNLLMANGHPHAAHYPLGMVADEASFVVERENRRIASEGMVIQAAAGTVLGGTEGGKNFDELIKKLAGD